jgi:hypothetical protein
MTIEEMKREIRVIEVLVELGEVDATDAAAAIIELQKSIIHQLERKVA